MNEERVTNSPVNTSPYRLYEILLRRIEILEIRLDLLERKNREQHKQMPEMVSTMG